MKMYSVLTNLVIFCYVFVPFQPGAKPGVNGLDLCVDDVERQKTEPMDTVFVRQVAPSGPADRAGLSTGEN